MILGVGCGNRVVEMAVKWMPGLGAVVLQVLIVFWD